MRTAQNTETINKVESLPSDYNDYTQEMVKNLNTEAKIEYRNWVINSTLDKYNRLDEIQKQMVISQIFLNILGDKWYNNFDSDKREIYEKKLFECVQPIADDSKLSYTVTLKDASAGCITLMNLTR